MKIMFLGFLVFPDTAILESDFGVSEAKAVPTMDEATNEIVIKDVVNFFDNVITSFSLIKIYLLFNRNKVKLTKSLYSVNIL
ncbi:Uncharacterised protein [Staphylococcus aureus]|nr:Uncharacterised protein [Staphylococcus aureus]